MRGYRIGKMKEMILTDVYTRAPKQSVSCSLPGHSDRVSGGVKWIGKIELNRISVHIIGFNFQCQAK